MKRYVFFPAALVVTVMLALATPAVFAQAPAEKQEDVSRLNVLSLFQTFSLLEDVSQYRLSGAKIKQFYNCMMRRAFAQGNTAPACSSDRHSAYFSPEEARLVKDRGHFAFAGVGVEGEYADEGLRVVRVVPNGASAAVVRVGDIIVAVAEKDQTTMTPFAGRSPEVASMFLRGSVGTSLEMLISRGTEKERVTVTRQKEETPAPSIRELEPGLAYLRIASFSPIEIEGLKEGLAELKGKGTTRALVLDLRDNRDDNSDDITRGALTFLTWFAPLPGTPLAERRVSGWTVASMATRARGPLADWKVAVLTDERTEGSAEIVAGNFKLWGAGVIGQKTRGDVSRRERFDLADGSMLQLSTHIYFLGGGVTPNEVGITPSGASVVDDPKTPQDEALEAAKSFLRTALLNAKRKSA